MAKIIALLPNAHMLAQAEAVIRKDNMDAAAVITDSEHVLDVLKTAEGQGALVAVARGNHAHLIKESTNIPLAEIRLNGQEIASLIHRAKLLLEPSEGDERPLIALVGFYNMFTAHEPLAKILNANVRVYYAMDSHSITQTVDAACADGAKVVVGGEIAISRAEANGVRSLFLDSMEGSVSDALMTARRILFAIELEKQMTDEFMSLLNYSFDAIVKLNAAGEILIANYMTEKAFHTPAKELIGRNINTLIEIRPGSPLASAFSGRKNAFSAVVQIAKEEYVANLAALTKNGAFEGFILSMQEFRHIDAMEEEIRANRSLRENVARRTLDEYNYPSELMRQLKADAAVVAQYDLPLLITGVYGTDKCRIAESIHNAGIRHKRPFVRLDLSTLPSAVRAAQLMAASPMETAGGERRVKTAVELAYGGTLLIENAELLEGDAQVQLLSILKDNWVQYPDGRRAFSVNARVICTTDVDLERRAYDGGFSLPLYTHMARTTLRVPSLAERAEDMNTLISELVEKHSARYKKYVRLQAKARAALASSPWRDDEMGLNNFLEKTVLYASANEVDADFVRRLMPERAEGAAPVRPSPIVDSTEEAELLSVMQTYHGNRALMARALDISKTTLWRRMKKYNMNKG